ncbi:MAG TPA: lipocalin family protein [Puia sp.]|jgi:hypothetical protein|nr:lipocalin family protein [Puia sp.]
MKNKTVYFVGAKIKQLIVFGCVVFGSASFTNCQAQSIVGKWKGVSVKNYFSEAFAKQTGKPMEEKFPKDAGNSDIDYRQDHTFILSFSAPNSSEVTTMKGEWTLTGDQLKLTLEPKYNPRRTTTISTVSINSTTMVTTAVIAPPARIIKTIAVSQRM